MDISGAQTASSWEIPAGQTLRFDPAVSTTLTLTGNMIVRGVLEMRPARRSVTHRLVFAGVDESKFIGGGMNPVDSDVGLWVIEGGRLNLRGTRVGTTVSVHGTPLGPLYRNVRIQGTVQGRAHCFIHTTQPAKQYIDGVMFRFMGAAKAVMIGDTERRQIVLGRYGVHFHHRDDYVSQMKVFTCSPVHLFTGRSSASIPHPTESSRQRRRHSLVDRRQRLRRTPRVVLEQASIFGAVGRAPDIRSPHTHAD